MLSSVGNSLEAWSRMGWYGFVIVFGGLFFFYAGGSRVLKKMQARRVKAENIKKASSNLDSGAGTPDDSHVVAPVDLMAEEVVRELEKVKREE